MPDDLNSEIDVLSVAKTWSLFVSKDLKGTSYGFGEVAKFLIPSSYQYEIAAAYARGIDITFTSIHTLKNPPFTDESVSNYIRLSENCFSVDIYFNKHMTLGDGRDLVDTMTERLYFVKYDDPSNNWDTPSWKLVSMKEIGNNAE